MVMLLSETFLKIYPIAFVMSSLFSMIIILPFIQNTTGLCL